MARKFVFLLVIVTALGAAAVVAEEGTTGALGTLTMKETTYPLKHAVPMRRISLTRTRSRSS